MRLRGHPYSFFLAEVEKPQRYIGGEYGTVIKAGDDLAARMVLVFPDVYEVGMSHLGMAFMYSYINGHDDLSMERCFAAWPDMEARLRAEKLPLVSLETRTPLKEFDCVGFSLQYELTFPTILAALDLADIPLRTKDRDDSHPIIIGGGPLATYPETIAPFFDAFFVGEAEADFAKILREIGELRRKGTPRKAIWQRLAGFEGVYCPALYKTKKDPENGLLIPVPDDPAAPAVIKRVYVKDLKDAPLPKYQPMAWNQVIFDRVTVELARGCSEGCRFCHAGYAYRPTRERGPDDVINGVLNLVNNMGYNEVSLSSLSPADYPGIDKLLPAVSRHPGLNNVSISVSSLRAYGLSDETLDAIKQVRATGLTMAPEAGTQRLRDVINKNISEQQIVDSIDRVFSHGWSKLKLYFMIGLPTETMEDCQAIRKLADLAFRTARKYKHRPRLVVSVSTFVPKPQTPFQWQGFAGLDEVREKQQCLRDLFRGSAIDLRLHDPMISTIEAAICHGDRKIADVIENAFRGGARLDAWGDQFKPEVWTQAFKEAGIDLDSSKALPVESVLPWDHIDTGVKKGFLHREYLRSLEAKTTPPCEKPAKWSGDDDFLQKNSLICHKCGLPCDTKDILKQRRAIIDKAGGLAQDNVPLVKKDPNTAIRVHLVFTKLDTAAFLSGLDLVRHIPRILRRAGIELMYTGGFHPRPKLSSRDLLGLGFRSLGEWTDARVYGRIPTVEELNKVSLHGIRFLSVSVVQPGTRPKTDNMMQYLMFLPDFEFNETMEDSGYLIESMETQTQNAGWKGFFRLSRVQGKERVENVISALVHRPVSRYNFFRLYDSPYGDENKIRLEDVKKSIDIYRGGIFHSDNCSNAAHILGTKTEQ